MYKMTDALLETVQDDAVEPTQEDWGDMIEAAKARGHERYDWLFNEDQPLWTLSADRGGVGVIKIKVLEVYCFGLEDMDDDAEYQIVGDKIGTIYHANPDMICDNRTEVVNKAINSLLFLHSQTSVEDFRDGSLDEKDLFRWAV